MMRPDNILHSRFFCFVLMSGLIVAGALGVMLNNAHSAQAMNLKSVDSPSVADVPQLYGSFISLGSGIQAVTESAPTLADLTGDGKLDIIVGTSNGWVVTINGANGAILW